MLQIMSEKVRRFLGLFFALAFVVAGVAQGAHASDMAVKMSAASTSDMPMSGGCSGCNGDDDGMAMACFAVCGSIVAAILPSAPTVAPEVLKSLATPLIASVVDHHGPPDPYPPRSSKLG